MNDAHVGAWVRVPQQRGTPWVLPAVGVVALVQRRYRDAAVAVLALPMEKAVEVGTKKVLERPRPLYVMATELRDDAPVEGASFPSGHTAIAVCATVLLAPHLPRSLAAALVAATGVSAFARVHQGAHLPGDVVGGATMGVAVASTVLVGVDRAFRAVKGNSAVRP